MPHPSTFGNRKAVQLVIASNPTITGSVKLTPEEIDVKINQFANEILDIFVQNNQDPGCVDLILKMMIETKSIKALYILSKQGIEYLVRIRDVCQRKLNQRRNDQVLSIKLDFSPIEEQSPFLVFRLLDVVGNPQ